MVANQQMVRVEPAKLGGTMDTMTVATMLAQSGFFGDVKQAGQALAKILAGQELGMGPIASLMGVYYQQGKVTYSANLIAAAVKKSGRYTYRVKHLGEDACTLEFVENGAMIGVSTFTVDDAKTAGLLDGPNKHNWAKFRRNMLFARAMTNGCRWYCPDVFGGIAPYTPDEFGAEVTVTDAGDFVPVDPPAPVHALAGRMAARDIVEPDGRVTKRHDEPRPVDRPQPTQAEQDKAHEIMGGQPVAEDAPRLSREDLLWAFRDLAPRMVRAGCPDRRYATIDADGLPGDRLAAGCKTMLEWLWENGRSEHDAHIAARNDRDEARTPF